MTLQGLSKRQKMGLGAVVLVALIALLGGTSKSLDAPFTEDDKRTLEIASRKNLEAEPKGIAALKQAKLKPAKDATIDDLMFSSFSGWLQNIQPQIHELAKCDAALLLAPDQYQKPMLTVVADLRKTLHSVLAATSPDANLYDLEVEYRGAWWATKGYLEGIAKSEDMSIAEVAKVQAEACIAQHHPQGMKAVNAQ